MEHRMTVILRAFRPQKYQRIDLVPKRIRRWGHLFEDPSVRSNQRTQAIRDQTTLTVENIYSFT